MIINKKKKLKNEKKIQKKNKIKRFRCNFTIII